MLVRLIRRVVGRTPPALTAGARLVPASELLPAFRAAGRGPALALATTAAQVDALRALVEDDAGWQRLCAMVERTGDPWNADDWPDGFDPLLLCAALCDEVAFDCRRCAVGERQGGMSCAHPRSLFGRILPQVQHGDRQGLLAHLRVIHGVLRGESRWDPIREESIDATL